MDLQYKYVVRNGDGSVARWMAGDNFSLQTVDGDVEELPSTLRVSDSWDASVHAVEVCEHRSSAHCPHACQPTQASFTTSINSPVNECFGPCEYMSTKCADNYMKEPGLYLPADCGVDQVTASSPVCSRCATAGSSTIIRDNADSGGSINSRGACFEDSCRTQPQPRQR